MRMFRKHEELLQANQRQTHTHIPDSVIIGAAGAHTKTISSRI